MCLPSIRFMTKTTPTECIITKSKLMTKVMTKVECRFCETMISTGEQSRHEGTQKHRQNLYRKTDSVSTKEPAGKKFKKGKKTLNGQAEATNNMLYQRYIPIIPRRNFTLKDSERANGLPLSDLKPPCNLRTKTAQNPPTKTPLEEFKQL